MRDVRASRGLAALAVLAALAAAAACTGGGARGPALLLPEPTGAGPPEVLVVISISGLVPAHYRGEPPAMPTLAALAREGVAADAVVGVAPAAEYPAHATLVTGRLPAGHGIVADRRLGERGVRRARYSHASLLRAPTLWQAAVDAARGVAALGWPTTVGAAIPFLLPDVDGARRDESWLESLRGAASPRALELARAEGGADASAAAPGAARDAVLVAVACRLAAEPKPPSLLLLHLAQTRDALARAGPEAPETRTAFAAADAEVTRLLRCLADAGRLATSAVAVAGDHGGVPVHTVLAPNAILARAGLLTPDPRSAGLLSWSAVARSNGGSAFVYAEGEDDALLARRALESGAARTRAFRIVAAAQLLGQGADPAAWFGLEAEPGYVFSDAAEGPELAPSALRAAGGYLPDRAEMDAGFVAWGRGLRRGVRAPRISQADVAPTLARLVGLELADADGRALVGLLERPGGG
jgi:predicted AlkP superfamily pyrophosphatase or phosphodiesterase